MRWLFFWHWLFVWTVLQAEAILFSSIKNMKAIVISSLLLLLSLSFFLSRSLSCSLCTEFQSPLKINGKLLFFKRSTWTFISWIMSNFSFDCSRDDFPCQTCMYIILNYKYELTITVLNKKSRSIRFDIRLGASKLGKWKLFPCTNSYYCRTQNLVLKLWRKKTFNW